MHTLHVPTNIFCCIQRSLFLFTSKLSSWKTPKQKKSSLSQWKTIPSTKIVVKCFDRRNVKFYLDTIKNFGLHFKIAGWSDRFFLFYYTLKPNKTVIRSISTLHNISIYSIEFVTLPWFFFLFSFSITMVCANFMDEKSAEAVPSASNHSQSPSFGPQTTTLVPIDTEPVIIKPLLRNGQASIRLEQPRLTVSIGNRTFPLIQKSNEIISTQQNPVVIPVTKALLEKSSGRIIFFPTKQQSENRSNLNNDKPATEEAMNLVDQCVRTPSKSPANVAGQSQPIIQSTKKKAENTTADGSLESKQKVSKRYKCDSCDYSTDYTTTFKRHMRTHTGERPYRCEICQNSFTEQTSLRRHMKMHGQLFPYQCSNCRQGFSHQHLLHLHEKSCSIKQFECYVCDKKFHQYHVNLLVHMRRKHTGERPYTCAKCTQKFCQSSHLSRHMKICRHWL